MVGRRRRLGKYTPVWFAEPAWNEDHLDWIRLNEELPADHLARRMVEAMQVLDLTPLFASYSAGGARPIRPDLMLRVVLIEIQQGRFRPSQWCRDVREQIPLMWAAFGIRPSRSCWYEFADRIAPFVDAWNRQMLDEARRRKTTPATRAAMDGSAVAANASRHRLLNEHQLLKRQAELEQACGADEAGEPLATRPGWMATTPRGRSEQRQRLQQARRRLAQLQAINARQQASDRRPTERIVVSPSDAEAALGRDKLKVFRPMYNVQLVCDLDSPLILGYDLFAQSGDEGTLKPMLGRLRGTFDIPLETLLADPAYITACNLALAEREALTLYGPWRENDSTPRRTTRKKTGKRNISPKFPKERFQWLPDENAYRCPQDHRLTPIGQERRPQIDGEINTVYRYRCLPRYCRGCPQRNACTSNPNRGRSLRRSEHEDLIETHKARMQTAEAKGLYKLRCQTVELGFADFKAHRNLQRFSGRGRQRAGRQLGLTVLAHNLTHLNTAPHSGIPPPALG